MVGTKVLATHRQPKSADREFDEAQKGEISPDCARPFTIEQEGERRDDDEGPCPGPGADSHRHEVPRRAHTSPRPRERSAAWSQGT